ncbi:MAG: protein translocase subunit SecD [Actinobacteria bacterium]|nr:protein translocase subunit SecD [Actinomycetota bacterium]MCB8995901.1 protein translocase subunit SecD [Actinomycetota bacterium]MCB9415140.1 protein translocase subunit SecD [Actinomycetota bacterium]MCB9424618.1 protein translocase subunit SecD [Actinomycetota bacterium]HRY08508.1 protein translocase subunit SecD [Candidatus Nanopelagicales bacterium]
MAAPTARPKPWRPLLALLVIIIGLAVWTFWPGQESTPRLGLDLQGGTQVILIPNQAEGTAEITDDQLQQTVEIIRQRVNGFGVAEADVAIQGSGNDAAIVVSVPGVNQREIAEQLSQTALLDFRPVSTIVEPGVIDPNTLQPAEATTEKKTKKTKKNSASGEATFAETSPSPSPTETTAADATESDVLVPPVEGDAADDPALEDALLNLDCTTEASRQGGKPDNPDKWIVTCDREGTGKYLLEPAFIKGTSITNASAELAQGGAGWVVNLEFDGEGADALSEISNRLVSLPAPQNQFGIVLDGLVVSAPYFQQPINDGRAQISGNFTPEEAKNLAQVLKFGALPLTLDIASVETVTPTLGADYLRVGLIAGALGLGLVVLYLLLYYRALGIVAVVSLIIAAILTFLVFVILGRTVGLALTLAGVAGAIVAIGITADSFVVYFERIRDEIREGRSLRAACDAGWERARNTILAADFVSLLAALVLYFLSVGAVRGFAFVLGLTTLMDVMVAFMFTRPMVTLLARNKWFTSGHPMTGLDPRRLGVTSLPGQSATRSSEKVEV